MVPMVGNIHLIKSNQITLIESSSRGFSDPIYNNMNTLNTKIFKLCKEKM